MGLHKYLEEKQNKKKKTSLKTGGIIRVSQHILISVQIYAAGRSKIKSSSSERKSGARKCTVVNNLGMGFEHNNTHEIANLPPLFLMNCIFLLPYFRNCIRGSATLSPPLN